MTDLRWMMFSAAMSVIALGCERESKVEREEQRTEMEREAVRAPQTLAAVEAIATARCDREQRCGKVGVGQEYANREACIASVRTDWNEELNAYRCEQGIEQDELSECVHEIREEDCGNPLDTIARVTACRSSDICAG